jgi:hypothetical protein
MNRRHFLVGTASGVVAFKGLVNGQAPAAPAPAQGGRGGGRGGGGGIPPAKLARISMMTLNHGALFKTPWATNATERQTMTWLEVPQYYLDTYGVRHVEFQHGHIAQDTSNPSVEFFRELKAKFDAAGSKAVQINVEIGQMTTPSPNGPQALSGDQRATWLATAKKWVDAAPVLGVERLMWNQTGLNDQNKAGVISLWKELQDYARPKGIKISNEMRGGGPVAGDGKPPNQAPATPGAPARGGGGGRAAAAAAPGAPANAPGPVLTGMKHAQLLQEAAEKSGGYTNLDFGGNTRFLNQDELHNAIKMMLKTNAGSMHIKSCENWDIGLAVKFSESQGYRGLYTIEVNPHNAITVVIGSIVSML